MAKIYSLVVASDICDSMDNIDLYIEGSSFNKDVIEDLYHKTISDYCITNYDNPSSTYNNFKIFKELNNETVLVHKIQTDYYLTIKIVESDIISKQVC